MKGENKVASTCQFDSIGSVDQWTSGGTQNTKYVHMDMLGLNRASSVYPGDTGTYDTAYTAFGEPAMGSPERDGYAGSWGYQTHEDFDAMHVGARYYSPEIGRFLQRDSIGIRGGLNVYGYVFNMPTIGVDPFGRGFWSAVAGAISGGISGAVSGAITGAITGLVIGGPVGALAGASAGATGGAISGAISGAVAGGTGASSFGGGLATGAVAGAMGGIGGGAVGGALGAGAGFGAAAVSGSLGGAAGAAGAAAANGAGASGVRAAAAVGAGLGLAGGAVGSAGKMVLGCVLEADAAGIGGLFGR